jgi:4-hydroxy-3-methylbut-2-enyl diphosphate reductase
LHKKAEIMTENWLPSGPLVIGITAGASCPNNLIEETILRVYELRGVPPAEILEVSAQLANDR